MADRKEFLKTIDEQQQQLQRYKRRLRDVVSAYKSLQNEKEALEASLKALSSAPSDPENGPSSDGSASTSTVQPDTETTTPERQQSKLPADQDGNASDKVATLMRALTTLTEEKSRMESHFQADKKKLMQEKTQLENDLQAETIEGKKAQQKSNGLVSELRNKLRSQQMEREREQNNHAVMLRELQSLVGSERSAKEHLENKLDDLQRLLDKRGPSQEKCEEYRQQINDLSKELQAVRGRLKLAEEKATQPQPLLLKLQQEMADVKMQNQEAVLQESHRANEAEDCLQHIARQSEERVASLEARLSELSEIVGSYDRVRQQDQQAIQRLKERVAQLDIENTALVRAAGQRSPDCQSNDNDEDLNLDVQGLIQKITKLKGLLKVANQRSQNPIDLQDFLQQEGSLLETSHDTCKEELHALKEEFERYKLRAQSFLKNRSTRDGDSGKEIETLKVSVAELRNKVRNLNEELEDGELEHERRVQGLEKAMSVAKSQGVQELLRQESEFKVKVADLENQMQKQRARTMALITEKDTEINMLKLSFGILRPPAEKQEAGGDEETEKQSIHEDSDATGDALSAELSEVLKLGQQESRHLHYLEEIAKKGAEVSSLRKSNHQLETAIRDLQMKLITRDDRHKSEVEALRGEIGRLERNCSREGANLEYLKNVVVSYMLSSDVNSRQHMLNAIATLLKFSRAELQSIKKYNASWWSATASAKHLGQKP